ncbi:unnamed protein product [Symbiodinium natans]|uniref:Uncharacterized protein n=1 Tax=Symbiodinium natans TaxID=878477 RepID=A0A812S5J8_9DINO|nr:unnamed protein product [Symbiodinium natans]
MFPGSLKLFQRSTEANYRIEIARHYIINVRQLWMFLRHAAHLSDHVRGVTLDGLEKACAAINSLACSLRTQEQHEASRNFAQRQSNRLMNPQCSQSVVRVRVVAGALQHLWVNSSGRPKPVTCTVDFFCAGVQYKRLSEWIFPP